MAFNDDVLLMLEAAIQLNPGTITYNGRSATCYTKYTQFTDVKMDEFGFDKSYLDFKVMVKTSDVSSWGLKEKESVVTVDGTEYMVGGYINRNAIFWTIALRRKQVA